MLGFKEEDILFKYRSFEANSLSILINQNLYFSNPIDFNDPFDGQLDIYNGLKRLAEIDEEFILPDEKELSVQVNAIVESFKDLGVLSLSERFDSILMWSHYANHHKGFCLGFSRKGLTMILGRHKIRQTTLLYIWTQCH